jgi:hypothetical protein
MGFAAVPASDEREQLARQVVHVDEVAIADHPTLQDREPDLDLVEPRRRSAWICVFTSTQSTVAPAGGFK